MSQATDREVTVDVDVDVMLFVDAVIAGDRRATE